MGGFLKDAFNNVNPINVLSGKAPWENGSTSQVGAGKKGAPPPPDYKGAAEATANASHVNQSNPFGSSSWSQGPDGQWSQSQTFGGPLQRAMAQYQNMGPLDYGAGAGKAAQDAAYGQATSRLDPQFAQQHQQLTAQLAAQGLDTGTEAAGNAEGNFSRAKNDAYGSAERYAVGQGQQAQQQAFGQSLAAHQQSLQSLLGLLGGAPGQQVGAAGGANYLGAAGLAGNYGLQASDQSNQMLGQLLQAIGAAGGAAAKSDARAKVGILHLGKDLIPGVPLVTFAYHEAPEVRHFGVLAQDVQKVRPDAVSRRPDGYLQVHYDRLLNG